MQRKETRDKNIKGVMSKIEDSSGFTLLELLITITLLGILAVLTTGQFGNSLKKANVESDFTNASTIAQAIVQALGDDRILKTGSTDSSNSSELEPNKDLSTVSGDLPSSDAQVVLAEGQYLQTIPNIKGVSDDNAKWYVDIPNVNKFAVKVGIKVNDTKIQLYPKLTTSYADISDTNGAYADYDLATN